MPEPSALEVVDLRCEHQVAPMGIDAPGPRLGWELRASRAGARQSAWQAEVRSIAGGRSAEAAKGTDAVLWDSGKRVGDDILVHYEGPALVSRAIYSWRLRVWDELGRVSAWSPEARWEMALLAASDWSASWIEPEQEAVRPEPPASIGQILAPEDSSRIDRRDKLKPCLLVRRPFHVAKNVRRARLYATAHGVYRATINGRAPDDRALAPEPTAYQSRLQFQVYDVTGLICPAADGGPRENVLGFVLADGWWAGRIGLPGASCQYGDRLGLLFQLEIEYADGSGQLVVSDEACRCGVGPWDYADLFIGERFDARRILPGWDSPGFDDGAWARARAIEHALANLVAQQGGPVRPLEELPVACVLATPRGETVLDFGQVIAGRVRLRCRRPAGTTIVLDHCECLDAEGNFFSNIVGRNKDQRDIYVCAGGDEEEWEPRFTYHGFRYLRVSGDSRADIGGRYVAVVLGSELRVAGSFACSDPRVNRLFENIVWSQRSNFFSIPTDCPQRERAGFTGDAQVFVETAAFNQDVQLFFESWLKNLAAEQLPDGQVPNNVPYWKSYIETFYPLQGAHSSAGWGDAAILVPWRLYRMRGDRSLLESNYPAMRSWLAYAERQATGYLWNTGFQFGDWLEPSKLMAGLDPFAIAAMTGAIVASCSFAYSVGRMIEIAGILGKRGDAAAYRALLSNIQKAFAEEYMDGEGRLQADFQGAFILALAAELVPVERRGKVAAQLVESIEAFGGRLDAGFVSIPFLMDVLTDHGHVGRAYDLLFQTDCPSWLYEVDRGATSVWESWSGIAPDRKVGAFSFNHYAFGCVGQWLYRVAAGLRPLEPGFKRILVHPRLDSRLSWAEASHRSPHGLIRVRWEREGALLFLALEVPQGCEAELHLDEALLLRCAETREWKQRGAAGAGDGTTELDEPVSHNLPFVLPSGIYELSYRLSGQQP